MTERRARRRLQRWLALLGMTAALSACGDYGPDMRAELGKALPAGWHVERFQIDEWEVINWAADHWSYRYTAQIAATEDLYQELGTLSGQTIVTRSEHKNSYHIIEGRALAALRAKGWDTDFGYGRVLAVADGKALSEFPAERIVVGTPRFETFLKAAQQDLVLQQDQLLEAQRLYNARSQQWKGAREAEDAASHTDQALAQEQQTLRMDRINMSLLVSQRINEADRALQLENWQKRNAYQKELDGQNAALREAYRTRIEALRKSVSRPELNQRTRLSYDDERTLEREYRNALDQAFVRYKSDLAEFQREWEQRRAQLGGAIEAQVREDLNNREAALNLRLQQRQDERHAGARKQAQEQKELERMHTDLQRREVTLLEQRTLINKLITNSSAPTL